MPRYPKNSKIIEANRTKPLIITAHYADETPEELWEEVCHYLELIEFLNNV